MSAGKKNLNLKQEDFNHSRTNMVLIEACDNKSPPKETLGERDTDYKCIINLLENPF